MYNLLTKKVNSLIFGRSIVHMIEKNLSLKNQKVIFYLCAPFITVCVQKKEVIERTRDIIYLKFVATDVFPKIISPSAGENSRDLA